MSASTIRTTVLGAVLATTILGVAHLLLHRPYGHAPAEGASSPPARSEGLERPAKPTEAAGGVDELTVTRAPMVERQGTQPEERTGEEASQGNRSLHVLVVDEDGLPLEDAEVSLGSADGVMWSAKADVYGRASFEGLTDSELSVTVGTTPGYSAQLPEAVRPRGQQIEVVHPRLERIRGLILAPDGKPIPHIRVNVSLVDFRDPDADETFIRLSQETAVRIHGDFERRELRRGRLWVVLSTGEDGRFTLHVVPGTAVDLWIGGAGRAVEGGEEGRAAALPYRAERKDIVASAGELVIRTVAVPMDRSLSVLVRGLGGEPVAHAEVYVRSEAGDAGAIQMTGMDGRASFDGLPSERMRIEARPTPLSGLPEAALEPRPEVLVPDGQEVVLAFESGVFLRGVVLDPGGAPQEDVDVTAYEGEQRVAFARSDADGRFRLRVPSGREYSLALRFVRIESHDPYVVTELTGQVERMGEFDVPVTIRLAEVD